MRVNELTGLAFPEDQRSSHDAWVKSIYDYRTIIR